MIGRPFVRRLRGAVLLLPLIMAFPITAGAEEHGANVVGLTKALIAAGGGHDVLLTIGAEGLRARGAAGAWSRLLVPGPVDKALLDPGLDVVWIVRRGTVDVLDLRSGSPTPIPILRNVPTELDLIVSNRDDVIGRSSFAALELHWAKQSTLSLETFIYLNEGVNGDPEMLTKKLERQVHRVKVVGKAWLEQEQQRSRRPVPSPIVFSEKRKVSLPTVLAQCPGPEPCGEAVDFGGSGIQLVITRYLCGDACNSQCLFRTVVEGHARFATPPRSSEFRLPGSSLSAGDCGDYRMSGSGLYYVLTGDDVVCAVRGKCEKLSGRAVGWLDESVVILAPAAEE